MRIHVLLADKGTPTGVGTLNLLNLGWRQTVLVPVGPGILLTPPHAVAIFYEVEPSRCNHQIELLVELWTEDGQVVMVPGPQGPQPIQIRQMITVRTPGGAPTGTPGHWKRHV